MIYSVHTSHHALVLFLQLKNFLFDNFDISHYIMTCKLGMQKNKMCYNGFIKRQLVKFKK